MLAQISPQSINQQPSFWRVPGRIAYIVSHSYPYSSNGYAVRTHGVARALVQHGLSVVAINRPGRPWDLPGFNNGRLPLHHEIDDVRYLTLREPSCKGKPEAVYLNAAAEALKTTLRVFKPNVVLAASNWENAFPAAVAARDLGLPFLYEVRGFWEITRASREPEWQDSAEYLQYVKMETTVARAADRVFTLNRFMRDELVRRGVDEDRIDLVPNAYGTLPDLVRQPRLRKADIGCNTSHIVGYVGSFNDYEGLDDLVHACARLRKQGLDLSLLLVGSSNPVGLSESAERCWLSSKLKQLAQDLGFAEYLHLAGRVPPESLADYYALIDLVVIPRKPLPVCNLVPPIKPLEAAAFGKAMLVSDVAPLKAEIDESGAGKIFKAGDIDNLSQKMHELLSDDEQRIALARKGQRWVVKQRNWLKTTEGIIGTPQVSETQKLLRHRNTLSKPAKQLRVACVMDEFTFHSFESECELLPLTPDNALSEISAFNPDLLFIESAWRGKDNLWNRKIGNLCPELKHVLLWCKNRSIPTVFWNKEDPIHFETFLTTAQHFDHVFTTDIDCINRYKAALGHDRIYLLPFACQPALHNPIEAYDRKDAFCFAGAYYVRYPERTRDLGDFVSELPKFRPLEIFDRNFGKDDVNYQFPPEYQPYIVGTLPFNEIDKAYKGYRYAINLNSIKQSQSMFARRVFELLGCNTVTVSNFSRGLRLLFGDLVITTDSGSEVVRRLQEYTCDEDTISKLRLAGLRKVMQEHTYAHRLSYVASKALQRPMTDNLPSMLVVAYAGDQSEYETLVSHFRRQSYTRRRMLIVLKEKLAQSKTNTQAVDPRIKTLFYDELEAQTVKDITQDREWLAPMLAGDYYGPNYLLDIALATGFCEADAIGKAAHYQNGSQGPILLNANAAYQPTSSLSARCAAIKAEKVASLSLRTWLPQARDALFVGEPFLAIDPYNYCGDAEMGPDISDRVDDLDLDTGIPIAELLRRAERIRPMVQDDTRNAQFKAAKLAELFGQQGNERVRFEMAGGHWCVTSELAEGKHEYFYAREDLTPDQLCMDKDLKYYLDVTPGLNVQFVVFFLNARKQRISHVIQTANHNQSAEVPADTAFIRLGLRVYGSGQSEIKTLVWGHRNLEPGELLGQSEHMVLTNQYPSYDDLYRNSFVHSRVKAYIKRGLRVDVFRLRKDEAVSYHEFQTVDVMTGSQTALDKMLASGRYKSVLVHFLNPNMWEVLQKYVDRLNILVWVHGAEVQPWHRRAYNYQNEMERDAAKVQSEARMAIWKLVITQMPDNLKLIFVSRYIADVVMEDIGVRIPDDRYLIIHNPIDTNLFKFHQKPEEQRKRILSIRPYANRNYANDLSVKAILALAKMPYFEELEFRMIGDGNLFDDTLAPLHGFKNVSIEKRFLTQGEIAELHREYGVFLCPTRMDTQGVSRDEAMSSGLVPVTNKVAAIPEFVDESCGILAESEDAEGIAKGISMLYEEPEKFLAMSKAAAERVRRQSSSKIVINSEVSLLLH